MNTLSILHFFSLRALQKRADSSEKKRRTGQDRDKKVTGQRGGELFRHLIHLSTVSGPARQKVHFILFYLAPVLIPAKGILLRLPHSFQVGISNDIFKN